MTRDVDLNALKGILVDHACIFEPYVMNREASLLENKLVLVDGYVTILYHYVGSREAE